MKEKEPQRAQKIVCKKVKSLCSQEKYPLRGEVTVRIISCCNEVHSLLGLGKMAFKSILTKKD